MQKSVQAHFLEVVNVFPNPIPTRARLSGPGHWLPESPANATNPTQHWPPKVQRFHGAPRNMQCDENMDEVDVKIFLCLM